MRKLILIGAFCLLMIQISSAQDCEYVGIGTSSPTSTLEVKGAGTTSATSSFDVQNSSGTSMLYLRDDGNFGIGTTTPNSALDIYSGNVQMNSNWISGDGGDEGLYVTSDGYVGVGTSNPDVWSLSTDDGVFSIFAPGTGENEYMNLVASGTGASYLNFGNATVRRAGMAVNSSSDLTILTNNTNSGTTLTSRLKILNTGNVGIGSDNPSAKLDVNGTFEVNGKVTTNSNWISGDGGDEGLYVTSDGYVGVGTTSPDIYSLSTDDGVFTVFAPGTGENEFMNIAASGTGAAYMNFGNASIRRASIIGGNGSKLVFQTNSTDSGSSLSTRMTILSNGDVGIGTNNPSYQLELSTNSAAKPTSSTWTVTSDERCKKEIVSFQDGLNVVRQINPIKYKYNGLAGTPDNDSTSIGILAQDMQSIAPYTVTTMKKEMTADQATAFPGAETYLRTDTIYTDASGNELVQPITQDVYEANVLGFDAHSLFFVLINALKELDTENQALKARVETLEKQ